MAQGKQQAAYALPLPAYNYRVTIGRHTLAFTEVSGLNVEYAPVTYQHGFSFMMGVKIIPGKQQPIKLTLKKGMSNGNDFLSAWLQDTYAHPFGNPKRDLLIDLCDEKGLPVVRWVVHGALPVKLDAPTLAANNNEVAIETLELVAHTIKIVHNP